MRTPAPLILPGITAEPIEGGWRVKATDEHYIDVVEMSSCARITEQIKDFPRLTWRRYWCYYGPARVAAAVLAANAWDAGDDTEPVGWGASWDGRWDSDRPSRRTTW
jgi:hypothetical protein